MDKISIIPMSSKAKILYKLVAYLMAFMAFVIFISFPLIFTSLPPKFRSSVIFTMFGALPLFYIPENIAYYLIVGLYGVTFVYFTYFTIKGDINRIYLIGEGFFLAFLLTIVFSFFGGIYEGSPEDFTKELLYNYSYYVLLAPLFEELSFRLIMIGVPLAIIFSRIKYLLGGIRRDQLNIGYLLVVISGVVFGIAHYLWGGWGPTKTIPATVQGIYLGLLFIYFDFLAGLTLHFVTNVISFMGVLSTTQILEGTISSVAILTSIVSMIMMAGSFLVMISLPIRIYERLKEGERRLIVIGVVGYPGAGKTEVKNIIENKFNIPGISMGDVVREEASRAGIPLNPKDLSEFAWRMRRRYGMDIWAVKTLEYIRSMWQKGLIKDAVVIEGIRSYEEVERFKKELGEDFIIIGVLAPENLRLERLLKRGRIDEVKGIDDLRIRDEAERRFGLDRVIAAADFIVNNTGTLEELERVVESIMSTLLLRVRFNK